MTAPDPGGQHPTPVCSHPRTGRHISAAHAPGPALAERGRRHVARLWTTAAPVYGGVPLPCDDPTGYKGQVKALLPMLLSAMVGVSLVSGCSDETNSEPLNAALAMKKALADQEGGTACELLAPQTRSQLEQSTGIGCADAILEENLAEPGTLRRVHVYGTMAQVRFSRSVWFLAEFPQGWRVMAAGCTSPPGSDEPYNCQIQGG
jgi:hypothetical protein